MNELDLVKYLQKRTSKRARGLIKGIGDDAAVIKLNRGNYLLMASDMLVEDVHFKKNADPFKVGRKAVCVNISDIAAMGGKPTNIVVSCSASKAKGIKYLKRLMDGVMSICAEYDIALAGGDISVSKDAMIDVAIIGEVEKKNLVARSGARSGDLVFVTGYMGQGIARHMDFVPRLKEARMLVEKFKINSMIDISDGLLIDIARLCSASRVGAVIHDSLIPKSDDRHALEYGEDYQLLFTMDLGQAKRLMRFMGRHLCPPVTLIGQIVPRQRGQWIVRADGRKEKIPLRGYVHFKSG